jgi:hypothetical protein
MGKGAANRILLAALMLLGPACGGGGGSGSGSSKPNTLGGTAAKGAAISLAAVTVVGANGATVSTATLADGTFSADLTGLTPPYLLRVDTGGGNFLYSAGFDAGIANLTPFTDLIVRDWYQLQNLNVDTEFLVPTVPLPGAAEIQVLKNLVDTLVDGWLIRTGTDPVTFDLLTTPFAADGTGIDVVLDNTVITHPNATTTQVVIDDGTTTQTSDVVTNSGTSSVRADTTTVDASGTSSSTTSTVVPTPAVSGLQAAILGVNDLLAQFENKINGKGNQLKASDLTPFATANLLNDGHDVTVWAGKAAGEFRGQTLANVLFLKSVVSFDDTTDPVSPVLEALVGNFEMVMQFKKVGASWLFHGNRWLGNLDVSVEHRRDESFINPSPAFEKNISGDIRIPTGTVSSVTVQIDPAGQTSPASTTWAGTGDNSWPTATPLTKNPGTEIEQYAPTPGSTAFITRDVYFFGGNALAAFPPPGTLVKVVLTPTVGSPQTIVLGTKSTTTSTFTLTSPTNFLLASAALGGTLTVTWTPPPGFLVGRQTGTCSVAAGTLNQLFDPPPLTPASTSALYNIPSFLDDGSGPQAVNAVTINVGIEGPHGERMLIIHTLDQGSFTAFTGSASSKAMGFPLASDGTTYLFGLQVETSAPAVVDNVRARLVDGSGAAIGSIIDTGRTGGVPFAAYGGGNYLMVWDDSGLSGNGLSAQLVSSAGALVGSTIDIARPSDVGATQLGLSNHCVTFDGTNFFIVFNTGYNGSAVDLYGVFVNTSGVRVGSILPISTAVEQQRDYSVAFDGTNFLVAFVDGRRTVSYGVDPCTLLSRALPSDVYGQFVSKSSGGTAGSLVGSNFVINQSDSPKDATAPGVAFDGTNYFVSWHEQTVLDSTCVGGSPSGGHWGVSGQFVSPAGAAVGSPVTIATTAGNATHYSTVAFGVNNYLIVSQVKSDTTNGWDVVGRYMDKSGAFVGAEFVIDNSALDQLFANVVYAGGKFAAVWTSLDLTIDSRGSVFGAFLPGQ